MAINTDPTLTKDILNSEVKIKPSDTDVMDNLNAPMFAPDEDNENIVDTEKTKGEIKLAGLWGKDVAGVVGEAIKGVVEKSEKKVYGGMKPTDHVTEMGQYLIVKPSEDLDLGDLTKTLTEGDNPGINFFRIGEELETNKSLEVLFQFDNFDQDLKSFMENVKLANKPLFDKLKRESLSIEAQTKLAEENGLYNVVNKLLRRNPGEVYPAEDTVAGIIALVNMGEMATRHTNKAIETGDEIDKAIALKLIGIQSQLSAQLSGNISEYARGMATIRHSGRITPSGSIDDYAKELGNLINQFDPENSDLLLRAYVSLPKQLRPRFAEQSWGERTADTIIEIWINTLLSSPVTHFVNMAGNTIFQGMKLTERGVGGIIGGIRTSITGSDKKDRLFLGEALAHSHGAITSIHDALILSSKTLWTETPGLDATKLDVGTQRAIGSTGHVGEILQKGFKERNFVSAFIDAMGVYCRLSGRALIAEDEFFKAISMRSETAAQAYVKSMFAFEDAINSGQTIQEAVKIKRQTYMDNYYNPTPDVYKQAVDYAKQQTFTKELDGFLGSLQPVMSHPLMKMFVPFYRTPVNIFSEVFDRTLPFNIYKKLKTGSGREKDEAMAKLTMGWGVAIGTSYLVTGLSSDVTEDGKPKMFCTGRGPDNFHARQALDRLNIPQYSCSFLDEETNTYRSVTFSRLDPLSGLLAMAVDYAYFVQHEDDPETLQVMAEALVLSTTEYLDEHPMMEGIAEFTRMFKNPQLDAGDRVERMMELVGEKAGGGAFSLAPTFQSYIPSASSWSATKERIAHPDASSTMIPEGDLKMFGKNMGAFTELPAPMRGFYMALQKAKSRNALFSSELPPSLNLWGEVRQQSNGMGWEWFSPVKIREKKWNPIDEELIALANAGAGGIAMPDKKINKVRLNALEYNTWIKLFNVADKNGKFPTDRGYDASSTVLPSLMSLLQSELYMETYLPDEKMKLIRRKISERMSAAKLELIRNSPRLRGLININ